MTDVKIMATSDWHSTEIDSLVRYAEKCDAVVIAGDFMPEKDRKTSLWLDNEFKCWCESVRKPVFVIAGNHDAWLRDADHKVNWASNVTYLRDEETSFMGLRVYGTPWSHWHGGKQRNRVPGLFEVATEDLKEKFSRIPEGLDILIAHAPPKLSREEVRALGLQKFSDGSSVLRKAIDGKKPRLVICGHVHDNDHAPFEINGTKVVCVSRVYKERTEAKFGPCMITFKSDGAIEFEVIAGGKDK